MAEIRIINGNGPVHGSQKPTRTEVEVFVQEFVNTQVLPKVDEMMQYYLRQVPQLIAEMFEGHERQYHAAVPLPPDTHASDPSIDERVLTLVPGSSTPQ